MKIKIRDAMGTDVGIATVTWTGADPQALQQEASAIFEPFTSVPLPTRNTNLAWTIEVSP